MTYQLNLYDAKTKEISFMVRLLLILCILSDRSVKPLNLLSKIQIWLWLISQINASPTGKNNIGNPVNYRIKLTNLK